MSDLAGAVRALVLCIPPGQVTTYGDIASVLAVGPRQVGRAMGILDDGIPWHRVVCADGTPASCHGGTAVELLRAEATPMVGGRVDVPAARCHFSGGSSLESAVG